MTNRFWVYHSSFLYHRKLRNTARAVLHNRAYKKALIGGSMVQACLLFYLLLFKFHGNARTLSYLAENRNISVMVSGGVLYDRKSEPCASDRS